MKTYFMGSWINANGNKYTLRRMGRGFKARIALYVNDAFVKSYATEKAARKAGREA